MKILIACEYSGAVRDAFALLGHDVTSCDLLPTGKPGKHYEGNVLDILYDNWDLVIAFPPCTDLAVSGARWFPEKIASGSQQKSIEFFMHFTKLKCRWAIENPIGVMSSKYRKPNQIIQPWQFGHGETKATCLWLNDLPNLVPTNIVEGREQRIWKLPPSADRWKIRSTTFPGIAQAMAEQWGKKQNATQLQIFANAI